MVARPQPGVCAESNLHGLVLLCQLREGHIGAARLKLAKLPELVNRLDERFSESLLSVVTAVGSRGWDRLSNAPRPPGLAPFPRFDHALYGFAQNQYDLAFIIRSDRVDANFFAGRVLLEWFGDDLQLALEHNLFHYLDNRNLLGFKCQRTLHGRKREQSCLLQSPEQPHWHLGSHLFLQHFLLHLESWQGLNTEQQQLIIGRTKLTGERVTTQLPSHADKTSIDPEQPMVWQQMPSASMREQGHLDFIWSRDSEAMTDFLRHRVEEHSDGFCDPLLEYQSNTLSCALFAPPLAWFERLTDSNAVE